jgi:hypothetical protein
MMRVTTGIEHRDLDRVEVHEALLHEVLEAAGAGHDDVDAGLERGNLAALRHAAEDGGRVEAVGLGQRGERCGDLGGQLAGGGEDEAERAARATLAAGELAAEAGDHGQREREGLAGAGLAAAEHVAPAQGVGQGVDLDREGALDALLLQDGDEGGRHAERAKGGFRQSGAFRASVSSPGPLAALSGVPEQGGFTWRRCRRAHPFAVRKLLSKIGPGLQVMLAADKKRAFYDAGSASMHSQVLQV